jgi:hypothetical protein
MAEPPNPWSKGTINLLRGEADRIGGLAHALEDLAGDLTCVQPRNWAGGARDSFVDARGRQVRQVRTAAAAHEIAAQALGHYVDVLTDLSDRRLYESDSPALAKLEQQRVEAATHAAAMIGEAAEELQKVRATLPDLAGDLRPATMPGAEPGLVAAVPAPAAVQEVTVQPRPLVAGLDPRAVTLDPRAVALFYQRVQDLSDAMHDHLSES